MVLKDLFQVIVSELKEGEAGEEHAGKDPFHHHREEVKSVALCLLSQLHQMLVARDLIPYSEYCGQISRMLSSKLQLGVSVFVITRCSRILEYLAAAAAKAYSLIKEESFSGLSDARKILNAVWLFVARVLTNNYSLDIRIIVCESTNLVATFLEACFDQRVFLDSEHGDHSIASKFSKLLDVFGLSPFWAGLMGTEPGHAIRSLVQSSIDKNLDAYTSDPMSSLVSIVECLRTVTMLTVVAEDFCLLASQDSEIASRVVSLVLTVAGFSDVQWALLNLLWLAEMKAVGFSVMSAYLIPGQSEAVSLSLPILLSGQCLTLLHVVGRSSVGAFHLASRGGTALKAIKSLVNIHSEDLLRKTGLWPMVVALIPSCSLGVTTSCNDPSLVSIRR
eukprot:Gregarina_sp_Poly_1__385@NODE_1096_length_5109_cov_101_815351_g760_i0_p2_GENE_NODE_1096_length_5109_cov_101_815351_g760_i0NODE_1096_length_5109_cov_101_815351_g760_i0_p2_ORF_typecomplete_len391_score49_84_NODE_1096_length_5109_cov_101_815351_g760_i010792251